MSENQDLISLQKQREELDRKIASLRQQKKAEVLLQIVQLAKTYDIDAAMIGKALGRNKGKRPPKYRDPKSGATWSGAGRVPGWMQKHEQLGGKREDFLI